MEELKKTGCKYCTEGTEKEPLIEFRNRDASVFIEFDDGAVWLTAKDNDQEVYKHQGTRPIYYCPVCGRKL